MEKHKTILLVFCSLMFLLFSFSNVIAANPHTTASVTNNGLIIESPQPDAIAQNQNYTFYWYVQNQTNSAFMNGTGISCAIELYKFTGFNGLHVVSANGVFDGVEEWSAYIGKGNFSQTGKYVERIKCNSTINTGVGGISTSEFEVTSDGTTNPVEQNNTNSNQLTFFIILLTITIGLLIFGIAAHDISVTIFASFAMTMIGLYMLNNGIPPYRTQLSQWIAIIIIFVGGYISVKSALDYFEVGGSQ